MSKRRRPSVLATLRPAIRVFSRAISVTFHDRRSPPFFPTKIIIALQVLRNVSTFFPHFQNFQLLYSNVVALNTLYISATAVRKLHN